MSDPQVMTRTCEFTEFYNSYPPCNLNTVSRYRRICTHKHIRDAYLCEAHARFLGELSWCLDCFICSVPHACLNTTVPL